MKPEILVALALSMIPGCHHTASASPYGRVLERGGEVTLVRHAGPARHGWERVQRGDQSSCAPGLA